MAANYTEEEEPAGFYPPYIEKRVVFPELYKKDQDMVGAKDKNK